MKKKLALVSVNIPTFNSAKTIGEALKSVKNQTYPKIEIIVADGYSQDKTVVIAKKYGAKVYYAPELGRARYKAFSKSQGKYILFFDSDQIMPKNLIAGCIAACEKSNCDALTLSEKSIIRKGTLVEKLIAYDKLVIDSLRDDDAVLGDAVPRFFKAKVLKKIIWPKELSVFDHTGIFLEVVKKGAKVEYLHSPSLRHYEVGSWTKFFRKFYRYGLYYFDALKNYPGPVVAHSFPRRAYFTKVALNKPHYFIGLLFLYFVKGVAAFLGVIFCFWQKIFKKPYGRKS